MTDPDDRTLDADPDALARLREIAREAARGNGSPTVPDQTVPDPTVPDQTVPDQTVEASGEALDQLRAAARAAEPAPADGTNRPPPRELSTLPDLGPIPELDRPAARRVEAPPLAEPWQPPPRSMRPAALPTTAPSHGTHPLWKWAALVLAAFVVALIAWLAIGSDDGGGDVPSDPTVTGPSGTVLTTGVIGQGGSGG